ncbi:Cyclin-dependent kinase 6, partial [Fragariocoptes setiger]
MSDFLTNALSISEKEKNYEKLSRIGEGAYGEVWKARDLLNEKNMVALKKIKVPNEEDGVPSSLLREIGLLLKLNKLNNDHVVKLFDVCHGQSNEFGQNLELYLVFEHIEQDLATYIERAPPSGLSSEQIRVRAFN